MNKTFLKTADIIIILIAIVVLYFSTSFWIGSYEDYIALKDKSMLSLFANRFLINLIVIIFFLIISFLINTFLFRKTDNRILTKKIVLTKAVILVLVSILMIVFKELI